MRTQQFLTLSAWIAAAILCSPVVARAGEVATAAVHVEAQVFARTSLRVSSERLQFDVLPSGNLATASVSFTAGARTASGADIVLTVESVRGVMGPGGAADAETALSFSGDGDGLVNGSLSPGGPAIVGQWRGSGLREGRVVFTLRADGTGTYSVPVRFVLSAP